MSQQFTLEQIVQHNAQSPFDRVTPGMLDGWVTPFGPDISLLFAGGPFIADGPDLVAVKSASGCHIGTLVQAPAGPQNIPSTQVQTPQPQVHTPQPQVVHTPQPQVVHTQQPQVVHTQQPQVVHTPQPHVHTQQPQVVHTPQPQVVHTPQPQVHTPPAPHQVQPGGDGQPGGGGQPGHDVQPHHVPADAQSDAQDRATAEGRRREEARNRRLRKTYNPHEQDPDDADEYPADAVAMGYLPDLDGRRWREKRMRLRRFIQFTDSPNVDDADIDHALSHALDLDFANKIVYRRHLRGGEARGCTGAFRAAKPPPRRDQLRPRRNLPRGPQGPGARDPPDSDDSGDDGGGGNARGHFPVFGDTAGRVRPWAASASTLRVTGDDQQITPPVTPAGPAGQNAQGQPTQPPPRPPQDPHQMTPEQEQEIARQNSQRLKDAADKALADQAYQARLAFWTEKGNTQPPANVEQQQQKETDDRQRQKQIDDAERKNRQQAETKRREESRKRREDQQKALQAQRAKEQLEADQKNQRDEAIRKAQEEMAEAMRKAQERNEYDRQQTLINAELARRQGAAVLLTQPHQNHGPQSLEDTTKQNEQVELTKRQIEAAEQLAEQRKIQGEQESLKIAELARKQGAAAPGAKGPSSGKYRDQVRRIDELVSRNMSPQEARDLIAEQDGGLVDCSGKIVQPPKGGKPRSGYVNCGTTKTPQPPRPPQIPKTPEKQKTPANSTPKGPSKKRPDATDGGQGPSKTRQTTPVTPTPDDIFDIFAPPPGPTIDPADPPYRPGEEPWLKTLPPDPMGDLYASIGGLGAGTPDDNPSDDDEVDLIQQAFLASAGGAGGESTQAGPSTNVNYTRVPEARLPAELLPSYGAGGASGTSSKPRPGVVPKKKPPPGGVPTTKSSPAGRARVDKKASSTAGSTLRSGKTRQTRR